MYQLRLLGPFELQYNGRPCAHGLYRKAQALLAYLAAHPAHPFSREHLTSLLWPELATQSARNNLRQALFQLRHCLKPIARKLLVSDRDTVQLVPVPEFSADIWAWAIEPASCTHCPHRDDNLPCAHGRAAMQAQLSLYDKGEFLAGFSAVDAPELERWCNEQRDRLRAQALNLCETLYQASLQAGDQTQARQYTQKSIKLQPWNETLHCRYLRLLMQAGQQAQALAWHEQFCRDLQQEFGVQPQPDTLALLEELCHPPTPAAGAGPDVRGSRPNRRQATVLCCFLSVRKLDADGCMESLARAKINVAQWLRHHGGHVTPAHGGYLIAYFGVPLTHQDAGEQAAMAALRLRASLAGRFVFHAGLCTHTIITSSDPDLTDLDGTASHIAMLLCRQSRPGHILVDRASHFLLQHRFRLAAMASATDQPQPQSVYELEGFEEPGETLARYHSIIGREKELAHLRQTWAKTVSGQCQSLLLLGNAGLGKSCLAQALGQEVREQGGKVRRVECRREHRQTPLYPFIALLEALCGFLEGDTRAQRRHKLIAYLNRHHREVKDEALAVLEILLENVHDSGQDWPAQLQKHQILSIAPALTQSLSTQQPLLLLVEQVQWADAFSLEILHAIAHAHPDAPLLLLFTAQDENLPAWLEPPQILMLHGLPAQAIAQLVRQTAATLDDAQIQAIVERADGVPLFARELALAAAHHERLPHHLPPTLQYLLRARLDTMPDALRTLQLAATIGPRIDPALLRTVCALSEHELAAQLAALVRAQLLSAHPAYPGSWHFHHTLMREVAYHSQLDSDREEAHLRIAQVLTEKFPVHARQYPVEIARHFEAAGSRLAAIHWWRKAGCQALRMSAYGQAVMHLKNGLELIKQLQANPASQALELSLLLPLGQALITWQGYGSTEAIQVHEHALTLCSEATPPILRFEALLGYWITSSSRPGSSFIQSGILALELADLARQINQPTLLAHAYSALANIALWRNQPEAAIAHVRNCLAHPCSALDPERPVDTIHPHVSSLAHASWAWDRLGHSDNAIRARDECLALAESLLSPHSQCFALTFGALLAVFHDDIPTVQALASQLQDQAHLHDLVLWRGTHALLSGWLAAHQGSKEGAQQIAQAVTVLQNSMPSVRCLGFYLLARAWQALGEPQKRNGAIRDGLKAAEAVNEGFFHARLQALAAGSPE